MAAWYYQSMGTKVGPVSFTEVQQAVINGRILPDSLVLQPHTYQWVSAYRINELFGTQGMPINVHPAESLPKTNSRHGARSQVSNVKSKQTSTPRESRLVPCPDCGHSVSQRANSCPSCGCALSNQRSVDKSSGGITFFTAHDVNDDGSPDLFLAHNTEQIGNLVGQQIDDISRLVSDLKKPISAYDPYREQWLLMRKWGLALTLGMFALGNVAAMIAGEMIGEDAGTRLLVGAIIGGMACLAPLAMTIYAMNAEFLDR